MERMHLPSICLDIIFYLLLATVASTEIDSTIELDNILLDSEKSLFGVTNNLKEKTNEQVFIRYRHESSGDGDDNLQSTPISYLSPSDSVSDVFLPTTQTDKQTSESSDSIPHSTTVNSSELVTSIAKEAGRVTVQNLTTTCYMDSAIVEFGKPDESYNISNYTVHVNNITYFINGDNGLTCNVTNLSSGTLYEFTINAEYNNSSTLIGTVNCTTGSAYEMNWFTIAGCGISIFWLAVSLICFCFIRSIHCPRIMFHANVSICLMIADGTILASVFYEEEIKSTNTETVFGIPCFVMPIVIHYFYLASLMWIGLEIIYIYRSLVVVVFKPNNPLLLIYVIGYIMPALIIGFCLILNYTYFNVGSIYGSSKSCWVIGSSDVALILLVFVLLILLFNIIMFIMTSRAISSIKLRHDSSFMVIIAKISSKWLCHLLILHPFLGGSWFLGFLQFGQWNIAPLLFAVFVTLQSFLIFLMHCVLDACIQRQIRLHNSDSAKITETYDMNSHVDRVVESPIIHDQSDGSVLPPPYTLVITGDGHPFEHQDLLPKKRRSLKGMKYSWNVSSTRTSVNSNSRKSTNTPFTGASFKPTEDSTLM